jgi:hypothetical protein
VRVAALTSGKIACTGLRMKRPGQQGSGSHHRARTHQRRLALRDLGVGPDGGQAVDANRVAPRPSRSCLRAPQFDDHAANGRGHGRARLGLAGRSTRRICSSLMPACRMRWRAPSISAARSSPCIRLSDRNSSCAATQSGTYRSPAAGPCRRGPASRARAGARRSPSPAPARQPDRVR